ncbi:peptidase E [Achromobacter sp. JUb104]|uniref:peptidase E n=1 Tax=Achromobacter sp. JUb104 TaxID=2940590 RepID=UPI0021681C75|nr:peptidase E [Achromobacter sp. JUb104]MCS3509308.1 dipeptidase E [Achromobacter sp. JUb104]
MRLYLSSYRLGDHAEKVTDFCRNGKVAIIGNALDFIPLDARQEYESNVYSPSAEFNTLGLEAQELDLREYFGRQDDLAQDLRKFGLVWVLGGNAFLLVRAMRQSGFTTVIRELLRRDQVAYGGFSAGAIAATPHLRGVDLMDDPSQLADRYDREIVWDGLGLVDFSIVPHFASDHPESHLADQAVAFMKAERLPYIAMRDGDAYVLEGATGQLLAAKPSTSTPPSTPRICTM